MAKAALIVCFGISHLVKTSATENSTNRANEMAESNEAFCLKASIILSNKSRPGTLEPGRLFSAEKTNTALSTLSPKQAVSFRQERWMTLTNSLFSFGNLWRGKRNSVMSNWWSYRAVLNSDKQSLQKQKGVLQHDTRQTLGTNFQSPGSVSSPKAIFLCTLWYILRPKYFFLQSSH